MNKTAIEWCDYTWNPVTGCFHNCQYCYARGIARRFGGGEVILCETMPDGVEWIERHETKADGILHVLDEPFFCAKRMGYVPYPYYFDPTFHRYRLDEPKRYKPGKVFVCSMADLFGDWVPDEWIKAVFAACLDAPQHQYLFLTKNAYRIRDRLWLPQQFDGKFKNLWYGVTVNRQADVDSICHLPSCANRFVSIEPITERIDIVDNANYTYNRVGEWGAKSQVDWVIVGAESGNRKGRVIPDREWLVGLRHQTWQLGIPLFMKNSLAPIWGEGEPLIQEFPKGLE